MLCVGWGEVLRCVVHNMFSCAEREGGSVCVSCWAAEQARLTWGVCAKPTGRRFNLGTLPSIPFSSHPHPLTMLSWGWLVFQSKDVFVSVFIFSYAQSSTAPSLWYWWESFVFCPGFANLNLSTKWQAVCSQGQTAQRNALKRTKKTSLNSYYINPEMCSYTHTAVIDSNLIGLQIWNIDCK